MGPGVGDGAGSVLRVEKVVGCEMSNLGFVMVAIEVLDV